MVGVEALLETVVVLEREHVGARVELGTDDRDCGSITLDVHVEIAVEVGEDKDTREWAMTMMLVARAIERIGDNAVDIGEQVAFIVTGLFEEFEDASHPEVAPPAA